MWKNSRKKWWNKYFCPDVPKTDCLENIIPQIKRHIVSDRLRLSCVWMWRRAAWWHVGKAWWEGSETGAALCSHHLDGELTFDNGFLKRLKEGKEPPFGVTSCMQASLQLPFIFNVSPKMKHWNVFLMYVLIQGCGFAKSADQRKREENYFMRKLHK